MSVEPRGVARGTYDDPGGGFPWKGDREGDRGKERKRRKQEGEGEIAHERDRERKKIEKPKRERDQHQGGLLIGNGRRN